MGSPAYFAEASSGRSFLTVSSLSNREEGESDPSNTASVSAATSSTSVIDVGDEVEIGKEEGRICMAPGSSSEE